MGPDDLLCSRNARLKKALVGRAQWKITQPPSLERERASLDGSYMSFDARSEGQSGDSLERPSVILQRAQQEALAGLMAPLGVPVGG